MYSFGGVISYFEEWISSGPRLEICHKEKWDEFCLNENHSGIEKEIKIIALQKMRGVFKEQV